MSGTGSRTFEIRITGDASGVQNALGRAGTAADQAAKKINASAQEAGRGLASLGAGGQAAEQVFLSLSGRIGIAGGALSAIGPAGRVAAAGLAAVAVSAGAVAVAGDQMTQSLAKLRSATGNADSARDVFERLYRVSLQAGVGVAGLVDSFARFSVAARGIGATNEQVVKLVTLLQQAGAVAGVSAEEASNAAVQLAQGLSAGTLQWEELKSIMEQMPTLAEALARELGVSLGQLRQMSSDGKLTADRVFPALLRAGEGIRREFEQLPPTMSRGFTILQEATTRFLADLDKALGLSNAIARALAAAGQGLEAARGRLVTTPAQDAAAEEAAAQARIDQIRGRLDGAPGQRSRGIRGQGGPRVAELEAELGQQLARLEAAQIRRLSIEREGDERSFAEGQAARERAAASQRERDTVTLRTLRETLNDQEKAQREHDERMRQLRELRDRGVLKPGEFERLQAESLRELAEANKDATRAAREAAREAEQAATKRNRVVASMADEEDAARREVAVLNQGTAAREALAVQLDVEKRLREAGIPAVEERTAAETAAAEAIERSVRATASLREEITRHDNAAREAQQAAQRALQEVGRTAERISDDVAESLFDAMTGQGRHQSILDSFKNLFRRIAIQALSANVFLPISTAIVGGVPELFGISGVPAGAGGGLGGIGSMLGLGSSLNNLTGGGLSGLFGLTGGTGSFLTDLGIASGLFGNGISPLAQGPLLSGEALGTLSQSGLLGSGTLGGFLGAAGLGFGAGSLLNSLVGGNATGGTIGSAGGALAGAAIGSMFGMPFLGALLGGGGGGLLGGVFGPGPSNREGNATIDLLTGRATIGGQEGSKFSQANRDAAKAAGDAIAGTLRQIAESLGARVTGGSLTVGVGDRDGAFARIDGAEVFRGGRDQASMMQMAEAVLRGLVPYLSGGQAGEFRAAMARVPQGNTQDLLDLAGLVQIVGKATNPISEFTRQMQALEAQFAPMIETARRLGYGEAALVAERDKAVRALREERQEALGNVRWSIFNRKLRVTGRGDQADLREFDKAAELEMGALKAQLEALGESAEKTALRVAELTEVQALEREALLRQQEEIRNGARDALASLGENIQGFLDRMLGTDAGGFSPAVQLGNARAAFDATLAMARLNDTDALGRITGDADTLLNAARGVYASGAGFTALRDFILESLSSLDAVRQAQLPGTRADALAGADLAEAYRLENERLRAEMVQLRLVMEDIAATNARMAYSTPPTPVGART